VRCVIIRRHVGGEFPGIIDQRNSLDDRDLLKMMASYRLMKIAGLTSSAGCSSGCKAELAGGQVSVADFDNGVSLVVVNRRW